MRLVEDIAISREEAENLIASRRWYHRIEICDGLVTPGITPPQGVIDVPTKLRGRGFGDDLTGLRILEVGTYDGPLAHELAKRGADVTALDIHDPDATGFSAVSKMTGIYPKYVRGSVNTLSSIFNEPFDVVFFLGVFYHLKDPIGAFDEISAVLKDGGTVHFEGEGAGTNLQDINGNMIEHPDYVADALNWMNENGVPMCFAYPGTFNKHRNWFLANEAALRGWLKAAGFSPNSLKAIEKAGRYSRKQVRLLGWATKKEGTGTIEHIVVA